MKETGVIMSGDHPVKVLKGTKTMTRRTWGLAEINRLDMRPDVWEHFGFDQAGRFSFRWIGGDRILNVKCPYGSVGDLLWQKENLYCNPYFNEAGYDADQSAVMVNGTLGDMLKWRWKRDVLPAMFMPRKASRALLEITELRVERLHTITPEDAEREGGYTVESYIRAFLTLNHIKKDTNPWDWVIGFKLVKA